MSSPTKGSYYVPTRCFTGEKKHRKIISMTTVSTEIPKLEINNNFESNKNYNQKNLYNPDFYHSRSSLLIVTQQKFHLNNQFLQLCNRIKLEKKKKELSKQRCILKTNTIKEFLDHQRKKYEYMREKQKVKF